MRRAVLRTEHGEAAGRVAAAVRPDNTAEMDTAVEGATVVTTIRRETTAGLHSTVDDYVVNLQVAAQLADRPTDAPAPAGGSTDNNTDT